MTIFKDNAAVFIATTIIAVILCCLIIPIPPAMYGLVYISVKAARGENVEVSDFFFAFRNSKRIARSYLFGIAIFMMAFVIGIILVAAVAALSKISESLSVYVFLGGYALVFILLIGLIYAEHLYVLDSKLSVRGSLKESLIISRFFALETIVASFIILLFRFIGSPFFGILSLVTTPISFIFIILLIKSLRPDIPDTADDA